MVAMASLTLRVDASENCYNDAFFTTLVRGKTADATLVPPCRHRSTTPLQIGSWSRPGTPTPSKRARRARPPMRAPSRVSHA